MKLLKRDDLETEIHYSQLLKYISAYAIDIKFIETFQRDLLEKLNTADVERECQFLDYDGEMFLYITPAGYISLCVRWKTYKAID